MVSIIVMRRSFSFSIVRVERTPGTPQPEEIRSGIKDLPDRPKRRKTRSITKATRLIYPQSSKKHNITNKTNICGIKPRTAPTPLIIPSTTRLVTTGLAPAPSRAPRARSGMPGTYMPYAEASGSVAAPSTAVLKPAAVTPPRVWSS